LKKGKNVSLTLDKDFIQYCELNNIEDIEKLAKETFKRGFDLLKYGNIPTDKITSQDKIIVGMEVIPVKPLSPPTGEGLKSVIESPPKSKEKKPVDLSQFKSPGVTVVEPPPSPKIIEVIPLKSSDAKEEFIKMGVITNKKDEKKDLYDE
jgi:hypothetical protein